MMKKLLIFLLILSMLIPYAAFAAPNEACARVITQEEYALVEAMWQELTATEEKLVRNRANVNTAKAMASAVASQALYVPNSLRWNGDEQFTFETTVGVTCGYSTRLRNIAMQAEQAAGVSEPETQTVPYETENLPFGTDVYLIEPYYQIDDSFTKQYQNEAQKIAEATGGTYHLYTQAAATIDAVAQAVENGAVVIFDSHGETDFARGDDYTSGATTSYLLLQTGDGLTSEDYADDNGTYHAVYYGSYGKMKYYAVDGTCIANHMGGEAPNSLLWMAICLGMATDGLQAPLCENGVGVAYGYSQSVTFDYDYLWEEVFFDELREKKTVSEAIAKMKQDVGYWDFCDYYTTISQARAYDCAFPIVVSDEDVYPGHGNVDALQTVNSTWRLLPSEVQPEPCKHENVEDVLVEPTCLEDGYHSIVCVDCAQTLLYEIYEMLWHDFEMTYLEPTCEFGGGDIYTCTRCGDFYFENEVPATGHTYVDEGCIACGAICPCIDFTDVSADNWFHDSVVYAYTNGLMNGVSEDLFDPDGKLTRAMLVTILYRMEGAPSDDGLQNPFTDVAQGQWYYDAVVWAANEGIVNGMDEETFAPDLPITREQIATILYRYSGADEAAESVSDFADLPQVSDYAMQAVLWAIESGIINGMDGLLAPQATATRAQAATMLMRYLTLIGS